MKPDFPTHPPSRDGTTFVSLQVLRGLAAWALVYFHYIQVFHNHVVHFFLAEWISDYGEIGVDVFFVLSGFVMAASYSRYLGRGIEYAINRVVRIVPNYWFYTGLLVISISWSPFSYITSWNWSTLTDSLLFIPNLNPHGHGFFPTLYAGWTLVYEMFFYMLLALCLIVHTRFSLLLCALLLALIPVTPLQDLVFLGRGHYQLWEFLGGILVYQAYAGIGKLAPRLLLCLVLGYLWVVYTSLRGDDFTSRTLFSMALVYGVVNLEPFFQHQGKLLRFLKILGDYSYSTYLAHICVIGWFFHFFGNRLGWLQEALVVVALSVVNFLLSWATYRLIETGLFPATLKRILSLLAHPVISLQRITNRFFFGANRPAFPGP